MKINKYACLLPILLITLLISSCAPKEPPECQADSDCRTRECMTVSCTNSKCVYDPELNCCGNEVCEEEANEDKCSCSSDCGKCSGKGKIEIRPGRFKDTQYLEYFCNEEDKCVFGVGPGAIKQVQLVSERESTYFKLETLATFNQPFNVKFDKIKFEIRLTDTDEDLVLPMKMTSVQLRAGSVFFGEATIDDTLDEVGDKVTVEVPLTYQPSNVEEEKEITYKVSYEYTKIRDDEQELVRDDFEKRLSTKVFLINPGDES